jgi:hypothetical protein
VAVDAKANVYLAGNVTDDVKEVRNFDRYQAKRSTLDGCVCLRREVLIVATGVLSRI